MVRTCRKILLAGLAVLLASSASAHDFKNGEIAVLHPWARPTPDGTRLSAAYFDVMNTGSVADTLLSAQTPAAEKVEFHEVQRDGDVMRMRELKGGIPLPAGVTVSLKPGGYHAMLIGLTGKLQEGASIPLKLTFKQAGEITVDVKIEKVPPAQSAGQDHNHTGHNR